MNLIPPPRSLNRRAGSLLLPPTSTFRLEGGLKAREVNAIVARLQSWNTGLRADEEATRIVELPRGARRPADILAIQTPAFDGPAAAKLNRLSPDQRAEAYTLQVTSTGISIGFVGIGGLRAAVATLRQLLREYGRRLPCLSLLDWPDFPHRGVMLDVSRGRVPNLQTLLDLADRLADFKVNELQLYMEHTFAYRDYKSIWREWGALTATEIRKLDAYCRELGIELIPNQNSFGHLREFLASPKLSHLAEIAEPWPDGGGRFWRYPSTLAPHHPGTLPFLRTLYDELLPNFSSRRVNVGCDETWDLGRGQSRERCRKAGRESVYLSFLNRIHKEVAARGLRMMFWGDIILRRPGMIQKLPPEIIALNWGYEANHPFERETRQFARAGIPFYVCPGTSTWATLIGKHDNAFANLKSAARAGREAGAIGYLITDWGDGGHPQPLAVSWVPILFGAAMAWSPKPVRPATLRGVASRDLFHDPTGRAAEAALALGLVHRKLGYTVPNATPLGATIAAPRPETHELFCRDGLKYYARIPGRKIRSTAQSMEQMRRILNRCGAATEAGKLLAAELDLAARMAVQSCRIMLWQQTLANGRTAQAKRLAHTGIGALRDLERDFQRLWPKRNKATPAKCSPFLQWRIADYLCGRVHFPPEIARRD